MWLAAASVESSLRGDWSRLQAEWQHIFKGTPALLCGGLLGLGAGALWSAMVLWRTGCVAGKRLANCLRFLGKGVLWGLISGALYSGLGYVVLALFAGWSLVGAIFGLIYPPVGGLFPGSREASWQSSCPSCPPKLLNPPCLCSHTPLRRRCIAGYGIPSTCPA
jgi:hypothetical protein